MGLHWQSVLFRILFLNAPTSHTTRNCEMISKSKSCLDPFASLFFLIKKKSWSSYKYLIHYQSESGDTPCSFKWSSCWLSTLEWLAILWVRNPISFEHMSFWYLFFNSRLTIKHSNIGVCITVVFDLGTSYFTCKVNEPTTHLGHHKLHRSWWTLWAIPITRN